MLMWAKQVMKVREWVGCEAEGVVETVVKGAYRLCLQRELLFIGADFAQGI